MRVRIRPGIFVEVSPEMIAKAEKAFAKTALTAEQKAALVKLDRKVSARTLLLGKPIRKGPL